MSLAQKQRADPSIDVDFDAGQSQTRTDYTTPSPSSSDRDAVSTPVDTGTLVVEDEGTSYIDSANWRAILEEINGMKEDLHQTEERSDDGVDTDPYDDSSPVLLLGTSRPVNKEEVLVDIPPRSIADRLVSRFLKTSEPSRVAIHAPTFQKEYEEFWIHPADKSFTWISLLYSIMALSVSIFRRSAEPLPSNMTGPITSWGSFRKRAAQCLIQANYITPGRYKGEALFFYSLTEFYRNRDAQVGVSYLLGMTIRVTMRMGYHRDPCHYPMLSALDGEMRRRLWALLVQLDTLVSFQVGAPRTIQHWQYDTKPPSNLLDTDFDENSSQLPPDRPENELTDCSYTRAKSHLIKVFGKITDLAFSREPSSYDETLEIDRRLEAAHDMIPSILRIRPMTQSIADPAELIMRRFTLELLYLKARLVLHRRYIAETNTKFSYSRSVCLAAARKALQHHTEICNECMPGGQLHAERYFLNSLQNTDSLLSAMIVCLELSQDADRGDAARLTPQERADFLHLLETTYRLFMEPTHRTIDSQRAANALGIMLRRVKGGDIQTGQSSTSMNNGNLQHLNLQSALGQQLFFVQTPDIDEVLSAMPNPDRTQSYNSLEVIEDMLAVPAQLDWHLYDSRISGVESTSNNNAWYSDGPADPMYDFAAYQSGVSPMDDQIH
ncbi:hypothetical protein N7457_009087 [Penicillium paradoxum]|uniref:uncharacterized protein n=1 Tax=Penicillium paradoxum TaxID=176176 RepID=UPI0025496869|nr:uncharacterized protein N7457_009087 [Penicillium paradoxum]KAJ5774191.1 hypothetical protein N7457_009087 [Penicillium paradoxum]